VPGEAWRSRFDRERNVIVVNNGHRDFVYASRGKSLKLRYLVVIYNLAGYTTSLACPQISCSKGWSSQ
jgi:hypothetical protein